MSSLLSISWYKIHSEDKNPNKSYATFSPVTVRSDFSRVFRFAVIMFDLSELKDLTWRETKGCLIDHMPINMNVMLWQPWFNLYDSQQCLHSRVRVHADISNNPSSSQIRGHAEKNNGGWIIEITVGFNNMTAYDKAKKVSQMSDCMMFILKVLIF